MDTVCTGDCLDVDNQGRIIVVPDNETIFCEDDGAGGTHLVARAIACENPWPFDCNPALAANPVYCDGPNLYTEKPYNEIGIVGYANNINDIIPRLNSAQGTIIREGRMILENNDPCCRPMCVRLQFNFNKHQLSVGPNGAYEFDYQITTDGDAGWTTASDGYYINPSSQVVRHHSMGSTIHESLISLYCGQPREIGMRMITGSQHNPDTDFAGTTPNGIYGFTITWEGSTDCNIDARGNQPASA